MALFSGLPGSHRRNRGGSINRNDWLRHSGIFNVVLGIIHFIFNDVNEEFIRSSYITCKNLNHYLSFFNSNLSIRRIKTISSRIDKILKDVIPDDNERNTLVKLLFLSVIDQNDQPESFSPSPVISNIIERYGLKL